MSTELRVLRIVAIAAAGMVAILIAPLHDAAWAFALVFVQGLLGIGG